MRILTCVLVLTTLPLIACGDDGDDGDDGDGGGGGGGGAVSTGLASSQRLSELTPQQAEQACERLSETTENWVSGEDLDRYGCTVLAAAFNVQSDAQGNLSIDREACETQVADCLADAAMQGGEITTTESCDTSSPALADCEATVGELETCLNASLSVYEELLDMVNCTAPVTAGGSDTGSTRTRIPECDALETKCPGLRNQLSPSTGTSVAFEPVGTGGNGTPQGPGGCTNTCSDANDGFCDDGGQGSSFGLCDFGTDCGDCGERPAN